MITSMTAFASAEKITSSLNVGISVRSVNSRYLDIALRTNHGAAAYEDRMRRLIAEKVERGRLEVTLKVSGPKETQYDFDVDTAKAKAFYDALVRLKGELGLAEAPIPLDLVATEAGVIAPAENTEDPHAFWPQIKDCLNAVLDDLNRMRRAEGKILAADLKHRLSVLKKCIDTIEAASTDLIPYYQQRLSDRIRTLTKGVVEIDPGRVAQEAAILANRSDISEEIVRVGSHLKQFQSLMESEAPAGRKLNFLLQELNREFNTIGSKAEKAEVAHMVVDGKSELEKIREQVQNIA